MLNSISVKQLQRLPIYLQYLREQKNQGVQTITSPMIARALNFSEEQVKKDLQVVTTLKGKPNTGRDIVKLIDDIETFLGYHNVSDAIIVGVGHLGEAFMNYHGFANFGLNILAGFDIDESKIGRIINGKKVFPMSKLENLVQRLNVQIAILTTPAIVSQAVAELLEHYGIKAIWNFAPVSLKLGANVVVENVDLASSLAVLSHRLNNN